VIAFVTGAAGFLGSHLCDELLERGYKVIGVDNFFRGKKENLPKHENFTFEDCDLTESAPGWGVKLHIYRTQPDVVVHYGAINGTRYFYDIPYKVCNDNIKMTQNVLDGCKVVKSVKKVVYASSSEIYGPEPVVPTKETEPMVLHSSADRDSYASSKGIGEFLVKLWAKENDRNYLIVRPFNTYGTRMATGGYGQVIPEFIERIQSNEEFFLYGDGKQTRSFCYVKDHTKIVTELIENVDDEILNVGFDEEVTIGHLAKSIHDSLGLDYNPKYKDAWANDTKWRKPDLSKLKACINHKNFVPLKVGIQKLLGEKNA
jgi:nucleoside-diphosphate-sugar epimerase